MVAPSHGRTHGRGFLGLGIGIGGVGYGNGGYSNGGYSYGNGSYSYGNGGYVAVACYITDPNTGFVYYCPYGLNGWQGWGSGWLPAGAYRVR